MDLATAKDVVAIVVMVLTLAGLAVVIGIVRNLARHQHQTLSQQQDVLRRQREYDDDDDADFWKQRD